MAIPPQSSPNESISGGDSAQQTTADDLSVNHGPKPTLSEKAPEPTDAAKTAADAAEPQQLSKGAQALKWASVAGLFYLLIFSIDFISSGFKLATKESAEGLFAFAENPLVGLLIGVLATTLIQSSSTTTSIVVGLVASGTMEVSIAVPVIMGANIGTTLTNTLASLGSAGDKEQFRRAFSAATVHDFFNLLAVLIFLPLEIFTGFLEKAASGLAKVFAGQSGAESDSFIDIIVGIPADFIIKDLLPNVIANDIWRGAIVAIIGVIGIFLVVRGLGQVLGSLMVGSAKKLLQNSIGRGPLAGIGSGMLVTIMAQSSSVTTSLMVPLAAAGTLNTRQIYPYTLGANVGTTMTALLAAFAAADNRELAIQIAFVHLLFNVVGILVIYGIPFLRRLPLLGAETLAVAGARNKLYVAAWVLGVYIVVPLIAVGIMSAL